MENIRLAEERRAKEEVRMIELLEQEAVIKSKVSEETIQKARAALQTVSSAPFEIIAQTIVMAVAEGVAETESVIKVEPEDYKAPLVFPTEGDLKEKR